MQTQRITFPDGSVLWRCPVCREAYGFEKLTCCESGTPTAFRAARRVKRFSDGPGTKLKKILESYGVREKKGCGCSGLAAMMNRWGPAKCRTNMPVIVEHLQKQAAERYWIVPPKLTIERLVEKAIQESERASE